MQRLVLASWSEMLRYTLEFGHGGAFLVVPEEELGDFIVIKNPVHDSNLATYICDFWNNASR